MISKGKFATEMVGNGQINSKMQLCSYSMFCEYMGLFDQHGTKAHRCFVDVMLFLESENKLFNVIMENSR